MSFFSADVLAYELVGVTAVEPPSGPPLEEPTYTREEVYAFLDALAATYGGQRGPVYRSAWSFSTSTARASFWRGAWAQYTDVIGRNDWYENSLYYQTFPYLYKAWSPPPPEEPPYEPPPEPLPPVDPPDPSPGPPEDPLPTPPPQDQPVEPPSTVLPPSTPGLDLPINPEIEFAESESLMLTRILKVLARSRGVDIEEIYRLLEKYGV